MIRQIGDMFSVFKKTDNFIITTNSYIRKDGAAVLGRGIAKAVTEKQGFSEVAKVLGREICNSSKSQGREPLTESLEPLYGVLYPSYGFIFINGYFIGPEHYMRIWAFQVKEHFKNPATLMRIKYSTCMLDEYARKKPKERFDMNFPGIGWGHLHPRAVWHIIQRLPDNVNIWTFKEIEGIDYEV